MYYTTMNEYSVDSDISFKECQIRSKLHISNKNLVKWNESYRPARIQIYLYNQEGSFISCYTFPTTETTYPESSHKYPGKMVTTITFDIISRMNHPTFMHYIDWIKHQDKNFKLEHQSSFEFQNLDDFERFIQVAKRDGFDVYIKK
jgi:hypothetical protein